jgi:EF-P beta-lysylation protein EpmB
MELGKKEINKSGSGQKDFPNQFSSPPKLLSFLELSREKAPYEVLEKTAFPFRVPMSFAQRMRKGDWFDPLLLQVLPRADELEEKEGFGADPVGDAAAQRAPGMLHKYASRVLLLVSGECAMRCRYCFRRSYGFCNVPQDREAWEGAWRCIENDQSINEVILSGGDPLCLDGSDLEYHVQRGLSVTHIKTVRLHTRVPVADPARLRQRVLDCIASASDVKSCIVVIQANHAAELAADCSVALTRLRATGALLLCQSVLLRGVNDSAQRLGALSRSLLGHGVFPYYLHQLDRVCGAAHFEVDEDRGREIVRELRALLPGYAVPRYVREKAGEKCKQPLA